MESSLNLMLQERSLQAMSQKLQEIRSLRLLEIAGLNFTAALSAAFQLRLASRLPSENFCGTSIQFDWCSGFTQ